MFLLPLQRLIFSEVRRLRLALHIRFVEKKQETRKENALESRRSDIRRKWNSNK
jgi:hypothetical protein